VIEGLHTFSSSHELKISSGESSLVTGKVLVVHATLKEIGDGFLTAVRVIRETGARLHREVIEHEERRKVAKLRSTN
jgi:hypothetical protein